MENLQMLIKQCWKYGRHAQQEKKLLSLTQPEHHGSHCVQGNGTGLALLQGLTHHGVGQIT